MNEHESFILSWETFNFYSGEIINAEYNYINNLKSIQKLFKLPSVPRSFDLKILKCLDSMDCLINLYKKQKLSVSDLMKYYGDPNITTPQGYDIDLKSLDDLVDVTNDLIKEMESNKKQVEKLLY